MSLGRFKRRASAREDNLADGHPRIRETAQGWRVEQWNKAAGQWEEIPGSPFEKREQARRAAGWKVGQKGIARGASRTEDA